MSSSNSTSTTSQKVRIIARKSATINLETLVPLNYWANYEPLLAQTLTIPTVTAKANLVAAFFSLPKSLPFRKKTETGILQTEAFVSLQAADVKANAPTDRKELLRLFTLYAFDLIADAMLKYRIGLMEELTAKFKTVLSSLQIDSAHLLSQAQNIASIVMLDLTDDNSNTPVVIKPLALEPPNRPTKLDMESKGEVDIFGDEDTRLDDFMGDEQMSPELIPKLPVLERSTNSPKVQEQAVENTTVVENVVDVEQEGSKRPREEEEPPKIHKRPYMINKGVSVRQTTVFGEYPYCTCYEYPFQCGTACELDGIPNPTKDAPPILPCFTCGYVKFDEDTGLFNCMCLDYECPREFCRKRFLSKEPCACLRQGKCNECGTYSEFCNCH